MNMKVLPPDPLLTPPHRQKQIALIRATVSLPAAQWQCCYMQLFQRLAAFIQQLPASEYHHHAYQGGLLDHCLEVAAHAASLRRGYTLPTGADPEVVRRESEVWTFAAITGALLHDVGKLISDQQIEVCERGTWAAWTPWMGPLYQIQKTEGWTRYLRPQTERFSQYRMRFRQGRSYRQHESSALLLIPALVNADSLTWLNQFPDAFNAWISYLSGHKDRSELSAIITEADRLSVAKALGGATERLNPGSVTTPPHSGLQSLHDKLIHALRYLVNEGKLPLNRPGAAVWLSGQDVWLVSKTCMDAARAQMLSQGMSGVPSKNSVLFDELQDRNSLIPCGATGARNAIWHATVHCGSWSQEFTLIRLRAQVLWPNGTLPKVSEIRVEPQTPDPAEAATESPRDQASHVSQASVDHSPDTAPTALLLQQTVSDSSPPFTEPSDEDPFAFLNTLNTDATPMTDSIHPLPQPTAPSLPQAPQDEADEDPFAFILASPDPAPVASSPAHAPAPIVKPAPDKPNTPAAPAKMPPESVKAKPSSSPVRPASSTPGLLQIEQLFVDWLRDGLSAGRLRMNEPKAKVHSVAGGLFLVTPGVFQEFMKKTPIASEILSRDPTVNPEHQAALWKAVQKKFESLNWHLKASNGLNIHSAEVRGAQKVSTLSGYFIADRQPLTGDLPLFDNPHIRLLHGDEP